MFTEITKIPWKYWVFDCCFECPLYSLCIFTIVLLSSFTLFWCCCWFSFYGFTVFLAFIFGCKNQIGVVVVVFMHGLLFCFSPFNHFCVSRMRVCLCVWCVCCACYCYFGLYNKILHYDTLSLTPFHWFRFQYSSNSFIEYLKRTSREKQIEEWRSMKKEERSNTHIHIYIASKWAKLSTFGIIFYHRC